MKTLINGYEIGRVECSREWYCIEPGRIRGLRFRLKAQAVAYAKSQPAGQEWVKV